jgi:hypothetical protein
MKQFAIFLFDFSGCIAILASVFAYGFKAGRDSMAAEVKAATHDLKQSSDSLEQSVDQNKPKPSDKE